MRTLPPVCPAAALLAAALLAAACTTEDVEVPPTAEVDYTEQRQPCEDRSALRNLYFGDLHAHSYNSWDAYGYDLMVTPEQAYAFAKGGSVQLPPLDASGEGTRQVTLPRPLDFAAVTDHGEYLGESHVCREKTNKASGYDSEECKRYRARGESFVAGWGMKFIDPAGVKRDASICGADGADCRRGAEKVWKEIQRAAERAYDRTKKCSFVSFVGYEYTASPMVANQHRNIIFRNDVVPERPITYFETADFWQLLLRLREECLHAQGGCDAMSIPHNMNWSNGNMYVPRFSGHQGLATERDAAALRAQLEPVIEIFQHKGDMECENGLSGAERTDDAHCEFEKLRFGSPADCGESTGWGGVKDMGCISRYDFMRGIYTQGLREYGRFKSAVNPYLVGVIGSTDTHNGTPGNTREKGFVGHVGVADDTPEERLGEGNVTHRGRVNNPGGLAAVWAVEKSRDAIFEAIRQRESYSTTGTRIRVRFFGGWRYPDDLCAGDDDALADTGYRRGVPMGGVMRKRPGDVSAPVFVVRAKHDPGTSTRPGVKLEQVQIIKSWVESSGTAREKVYTVAGTPGEATVDDKTCKTGDGGSATLCAVWRDPDFDAGAPAYYYVRVLENPTCRWSTYECNKYAPGQAPPGCADKNIARTIQERAVTSAIWYLP